MYGMGQDKAGHLCRVGIILKKFFGTTTECSSLKGLRTTSVKCLKILTVTGFRSKAVATRLSFRSTLKERFSGTTNRNHSQRRALPKWTTFRFRLCTPRLSLLLRHEQLTPRVSKTTHTSDSAFSLVCFHQPTPCLFCCVGWQDGIDSMHSEIFS